MNVIINTMRVHTSVNILQSNIGECEKMIESGQFESVSDVIEFSMRVFLDAIRIDGIELSYISRGGPKTKQSVRVNEWLIKQFSEKGMTGISEIVDYSITFYTQRIKTLQTKSSEDL